MTDLEQILTLNPDAKSKSYKKGERIQIAGSTISFSIYVKKGLLKSYLIDRNGKEHIYMFAPEGWVIGDIEAMEYQQETTLFIDCLEASEVIAFNKDSLFNQKLNPQQIIENTRLLTRRIGRLQRRVLMLMGTPAADRYEYFLKIYPNLVNRVPQKLIASYLGITAQTLSTIRSERMKK
jgi:CRP-like cAMP-binding protein